MGHPAQPCLAARLLSIETRFGGRRSEYFILPASKSSSLLWFFFFSFLLLTPPEGTSPKFFPRVITKISGVIYCHAKGTVDMLLPSARAERASANPCHCPHPCSHGGTGQTWRAVQQGEMGACRRQQCRLQRAGRRSGCRCEGLGTGRCLHGSSLQGAELPGAQQQW